jgi:hypothetical protein
VPSQTARAHQELQDFLSSHGHAETAAHLKTLRDWRNTCDYDAEVTIKAPDIMLYTALLHADAVLDKL